MLAQVDFNKITVPGFKFANSSLGDIISAVLPFVFTIAGVLLLIYLIFGGFQYMLSRGDPKAAEAARSHITNALVGFVIIFIAFWVVELFGSVLGLKGIISIFGGGTSTPKSIPPAFNSLPSLLKVGKLRL